MTAAPRIPGYELGQRLLQHSLAEIWRGRSHAGVEVVAIVLSEAGANDPMARQRLDEASRMPAPANGLPETPLWAANFAANRPYAITQLVPGQSGAERLLDPLDGVFGNDQDSVNEVRRQLQHFGAAPVPPSPGNTYPSSTTHAPATSDVPGQESSTRAEGFVAGVKRRAGWKFYVIVPVAYLLLFTVTYSVGAAFNKKDDTTTGATVPVPPAVSPGALPTSVVLPGIAKAKMPAIDPRRPSISVVGETYASSDPTQPVEGLELPFAFRWPQPPGQIRLGESSHAIYRRVISGENPRSATLDAVIAAHPCTSLADCRQDRAAFDQRWTSRFKAPVPTTAKDGQTWFTEQDRGSYVVSMTRAFERGGRWWLLGVAVTAKDGGRADAQRVLNDIRTQTS
ncbi:hypothetical protein [Kribbella deserti]|uniref:Alanine and proline-rich secreted protein Apa n=1 Tax=Kribbella deserti TaxID=1926257 RepID=A0ABV6QXS5_9ACTN